VAQRAALLRLAGARRARQLAHARRTRPALNLPGDKLSNAALVGFITRNYAVDERGCWYFQNGPQRVYVQLEATPYIVRTDPAAGWLLHTGAPLGTPEAALLTDSGALILQRGAWWRNSTTAISPTCCRAAPERRAGRR
jgi:hypothetical protein